MNLKKYTGWDILRSKSVERFQIAQAKTSIMKFIVLLKIKIFERFTQDIKKHKKERNLTTHAFEVCPEGFGLIFGCVGSKNVLEKKNSKKLKKLKKHTQGIRKYRKDDPCLLRCAQKVLDQI